LPDTLINADSALLPSAPGLIPVSANSRKNEFHCSGAAEMIASDSSTVKL
jgi:hypothetical protein